MTPFFWKCVFFVEFSEFLRKSANSTLGKRASFSQNSQKWHSFAENMRFSWKLNEFLENSINSTLGKRAPFSQNSQKWRHFSENVRVSLKFSEYVRFFCGNVIDSSENLQILPMGNVCHFRIIHENDILFLKMCVFRWNLVNLSVFS